MKAMILKYGLVVATAMTSYQVFACGTPVDGAPEFGPGQRSGAIASNRAGEELVYKCTSTLRCLPAWTAKVYHKKEDSYRISVKKYYGPHREDTFNLMANGGFGRDVFFANLPGGNISINLTGMEFETGAIELDGTRMPIACEKPEERD